MTLQLQQVPEQKKDDKIYLVIVGADGRKFNKEQEEKAKFNIRKIIMDSMKCPEHGHSNFEWAPSLNNKFTGTPFHCLVEGCGFEGSLIVVSGGCPVGRKRYWCFELERFVDNPNEYAGKGYQFLEVYDNGGIDTWVHILATQLGIPTKIFKPERKEWGDKVSNECEKCGFKSQTTSYIHYCPSCHSLIRSVKMKGYRSRNIDMAEIGTIGYTIEVAGSCRHCGGIGRTFNVPVCVKCFGTGAYSGGTFTINEMKKLGKEVHKIVIS